MKDIFEGDRSNLIFITIMTVFVRSNIAKFGQNAQFSKKIFCLLLKMTMTKIMRNESIMVQRRKSSWIKWYINFKDILIRTRDIAIIRMAFSSEFHNQSRPVLSLRCPWFIHYIWLNRNLQCYRSRMVCIGKLRSTAF